MNTIQVDVVVNHIAFDTICRHYDSKCILRQEHDIIKTSDSHRYDVDIYNLLTVNINSNAIARDNESPRGIKINAIRLSNDAGDIIQA